MKAHKTLLTHIITKANTRWKELQNLPTITTIGATYSWCSRCQDEHDFDKLEYIIQWDSER